MQPKWIWITVIMYATLAAVLAWAAFGVRMWQVQKESSIAGIELLRKNLPSVSVIIPSYARAHLSLSVAVESVLSQDYPQELIEVVVVNDCSPDKRAYERLEREWGERVKVLHLARNVGQSQARNIGVAASTGKLLAFLDDDDAWYEDKLRTQVLAQLTGGYRMSCTDAIAGRGTRRPGSGRPWGRRTYNESFARAYKRLLGGDGKVPGHLELKVLEKHNVVIASSVVMERAVFNATSGFDANLAQGEDGDMWRRAVVPAGGAMLYVDEALTYYDKTHAGFQHWRHARTTKTS